MRLQPHLFACALLVLGGCAAPTPQSTGLPEVPAARVERGPIAQTLSYSGEVRAREQITVLPKASGRVQRVVVDTGSVVQAGDVLAELDRDTPVIQTLQARAALAAASAKLAQMQAGPRPADVTAAQEMLAQQHTKLDSMRRGGRNEDVAASQAALAAQLAKLQLMQQGGRLETIQQARAALDQAQQKLALVEKGASDDVRQGAVSAVNADKAAVVAAEAQYAALGGTSAADLEALQNQVDTLQAQVAATQSVVAAADAALRNQKNASQADVLAAQTAVDQAQAQLDSARAALKQAADPTQASIAQAEAAVAQARAQRQSAEANQTALEQSVAGACAPMISPVTGTSIKNANGTACGEAKDAAGVAVDAGDRAVEAAQGQLDLLRRGGAPATQAALQAQVVSAEALTRATRARLEALLATGVEAQRAQIQSQRDQAQSQLVAAQDTLFTAEARLQAARNGTLEAQRKTVQAQVDAAREKVAADQARLDQLVAGPQPEELQIAQDAVIQAEQQLQLALQPVTEQEIAAQQTSVEQARQALAKAGSPFTESDIEQQEHVVRAAAAALEKAQNPFTEQDLDAAQAALDQARAQLDLAELGIKETQIVAPVDGVVFDRHVSPGTQVGPTLPVVTLIPPGLDIVVNIDEDKLSHVRTGQSVTVNVTAFPTTDFVGVVSAMAPAIDQKSRTVATHIQPRESADGQKLLPGMLAQVRIVTTYKEDALLLPRQAVAPAEVGNAAGSAATVSLIGPDNRIQKANVQLGLLSDTAAEVLGGLQPGVLVVVSDPAMLQSGDLVSPRIQTYANALLR
ncbi:MAG TPA: efflux RND transporter periplasmic adaptor subunit [Chloroflexota bacterium]|jgi:HlyD family secretion protein|nr:efflux RND transporter periplasmic adaptor subunit [Chloroflexota bacterium]